MKFYARMREFKMILIALLAILGGTSANAARQNLSEIRGSVIDTDGNPVGWATVALMTQSDSVIVAGSTCDKNGSYILKVPVGQYLMTASLIGFHDWSQIVEIADNQVEMPPIILSEDAEMLAGASITERVKLVEMKVDKVVVNVAQSAFAQGSNAFELIRKAPGVTIDKDGNVKLNGKSVQVWIDGRPSYLDGKSLEALLRSTNGESIERFELMEHPSSKYDAEGQGGIINIKTRRSLLSGFNGTLGADGGGMYFSDIDKFLLHETAYANLNFKTRKTNTFLNAYQGIYDNVVNMDIENRMDQAGVPYSIVSKSLQNDRYKACQLRLGSDWFVDERNTVGFIVNFPGARDRLFSDRAHNLTVQTLGDTELERAEAISDNDVRASQVNGNLNWTHSFEESGTSDLTVNLDYYRNSTTTVNNLQAYTQTCGAGDWVQSTRLTDSGNDVDIYSAKADYQGTVSNFARLEAGAKWALSVTGNRTVRTETGPEAEDNLTEFNYREHIGAAYFSLAAQFGPKWSAKAGLRGEYTNSLGDWISAGDRTERSYFDLFPTAYIGFVPSAGLRFGISYTRRISRPSYMQLSPVERYIEAHTYTIGDPEIQPSYTDVVGLNAGFGQHFSVSTSYSSEKDMFCQLPALKENGDQFLTWSNFGSQKTTVLNFSIAELPVTKWLSWTLSTTGLYVDAETEGISNNSGLSFTGYSCFTAILPKDWKIQLDGQYSSPMAWGYYRLRSVYLMNLGIRKMMLDNRLTLSINLDDILNSNCTDLDCFGFGNSTVKGSMISSYIGQKYHGRKLHIGLSWSFGQARQSRSRNVGNIEEASRIGAGANFK
jgi:iron complex outermembrane recepter protein